MIVFQKMTLFPGVLDLRRDDNFYEENKYFALCCLGNFKLELNHQINSLHTYLCVSKDMRVIAEIIAECLK